MDRVTRYDSGTLRGPQRLADGRLRVDGRISRVGVYVYRNADGTERRELRLPEEVFHKDALESFAMVPVTNDHPPKQLTAKSATKYAVGWTGESIKADDGKFVAGPIMIANEDAIAKVEAGKRQLSAGYTCDLEMTSGEHPVYGRYDAIQRNIRGNHVAIVDVGRAGPEARLRMDGAVQVEDDDLSAGARSSNRDGELDAAARGNLADSKFAVPERGVLPIEDEDHVRAAMARFGQTHFESADEKKAAYGRIVRRAKALGIDPAGFVSAWGDRLDGTDDHRTDGNRADAKDKESTVKLKINGVEFDVTEQVAQAIGKMDADHTAAVEKLKADHADAVKAAGDKLQADLTAAKAEADKQTARADAATAELEKERKARADSDGTFAARVQARVALEQVARKHLGAEAKLDAMSDRDVKVAVLGKLTPEFKAEGKTDDYLAARFDAAVEFAGSAGQAALRAATTPAANADAAPVTDEKAARARMMEANRNAWMNKEKE